MRASDQAQGTLQTIDGSGFGSQGSPGQSGDDFLSSECVFGGACVQACPTAILQEKSVKASGKPECSVVTTCACSCGVGGTFRAETPGEQAGRMVPYKDAKANRGHSCVIAWQSECPAAADPSYRAQRPR